MLERLKPDALLLQEVRVRGSDAPLIAEMTKAAGADFTCHYSLNRDPKNVTFRGGRMYGVVTYIRSSLGRSTCESEVPEWDREGRIVFTHLENPRVTIGNVYAVNGTDKVYWDHDLGRAEGDRHAFKRRFQAQLLERARELRVNEKRHVIVAGDWNVSRTKLDTYPRLRTEEPHSLARSELEKHLALSGMVDIYRHLHPNERAYTWFNRLARGKTLDAARVDYVLVGQETIPRVKEASILADPKDRPGSDHAPIVIELID
jgi:exodeoxyribonuclease III